MISGSPNQQEDLREANTLRRANFNYKLAGLLIAGLLIGIGLLGYVYLNSQPEKTIVKIGAGPRFSDSFDLMTEIADVVARHAPEIEIKVMPTRDSSENISLLNAGKIDLATVRSDTPFAKNMRLIAVMFGDFFQIITRADSSISSVPQLRGKTIAVPRFGTDEFRSFWVISDHYNIPIRSVKWRSMDFESASRKLLAGEVDVIFTVRSLRDRNLLTLFEDADIKRVKLRLVPIDQAQAMTLKRPFLDAGTIPFGALSGEQPSPQTDVMTTTVNRQLVTTADFDAEIARKITEVIFEYRSDLAIRFALASAISKPDITTGQGLPIHRGADQYFMRNEPSFLQENAEPLALIVTIIAMLVSALYALRASYISAQKNKMDTYNIDLLNLAARAENTNCLDEIAAIKASLFSNLETVVIAFDRDAISNAGFQSYSRLWHSIRDIILEHESRVATRRKKKLKQKKAKSRQGQR